MDTYIWTEFKTKKSTKEGDTEEKTLFVSETGFSSAWKKFQSRNFSYLTPKECKGSQNGQMVDCVLASDIGVKKAYVCSEVDSKTKLCTSHHEINAEYVEFWYAQKKGKWVLNTAYPSGVNTSTCACKNLSMKTKGRAY